jgi:hypothetical protein
MCASVENVRREGTHGHERAVCGRALIVLLDSSSARTGSAHGGIWSWPAEATCSKRSSCGGARVVPDGGHQIPAERSAVVPRPNLVEVAPAHRFSSRGARG